jgi:cytidylate kinase
MRSGRGRRKRVRGIIITIDGPAGAGKSTTALLVAERLGYRYLDTGAMYRAVALECLEERVPFDDEERVAETARAAAVELFWDEDRIRVELNGRDVTDAIRSGAVSDAASKIATIRAVREVLVARQREIGSGGGVVAEGRDMGTVVFPDAELKIYMDASLEERARRRMLQGPPSGAGADVETVKSELRVRDMRDSSRKAGPLSPAPDSLRIDTTSMTVDEQVDLVVGVAREILEGGPKR